MARFIRLVINRRYDVFENTEYLSQAMFLYLRYQKYLDDDYAKNGSTFYDYFVELVERVCPLFWLIMDEDKVAGFVYLDNMIGDNESLHSAELTTCFDKAYWGEFTKLSAKRFLDYCFETYGFKKIKASVYPQNSRVKAILKQSGFESEALLKAETLRNKELQDIEIYSIFNKKFRKAAK